MVVAVARSPCPVGERFGRIAYVGDRLGRLTIALRRYLPMDTHRDVGAVVPRACGAPTNQYPIRNIRRPFSIGAFHVGYRISVIGLGK